MVAKLMFRVRMLFCFSSKKEDSYGFWNCFQFGKGPEHLEVNCDFNNLHTCAIVHCVKYMVGLSSSNVRRRDHHHHHRLTSLAPTS